MLKVKQQKTVLKRECTWELLILYLHWRLPLTFSNIPPSLRWKPWAHPYFSPHQQESCIMDRVHCPTLSRGDTLYKSIHQAQSFIVSDITPNVLFPVQCSAVASHWFTFHCRHQCGQHLKEGQRSPSRRVQWVAALTCKGDVYGYPCNLLSKGAQRVASHCDTQCIPWDGSFAYLPISVIQHGCTANCFLICIGPHHHANGNTLLRLQPLLYYRRGSARVYFRTVFPKCTEGTWCNVPLEIRKYSILIQF